MSTTRIGPGFRAGGFKYRVPDLETRFPRKRHRELLALSVVMDDGFAGRICAVDWPKLVIEVLPDAEYRALFGRRHGMPA